jgi:uncharacterized membrane protein
MMARVPSGIVLGLGLGGFIDGIVLHQLLQWHNMGSAVLPPVTMAAMSQNMMWDGLFHMATWILTVVGIYMLRREGEWGGGVPAAAFTGYLLLGWGAFNLIEGVVDHHLLNLHHVRDLPVHVPAYDWIFLTVGGAGLLALGWGLVSRSRPDTAPIRRPL